MIKQVLCIASFQVVFYACIVPDAVSDTVDKSVKKLFEISFEKLLD